MRSRGSTLRWTTAVALLVGLAGASAARAGASEWARGAVFYEIFVRSFADSDGDGIGDLPGLAARLDYLNDGDPATTSDLGVDALWLMPVFESPSYHGYDVVDYERIDAEYGTLADFEKLLDEAHRRGMRVIVDFVMNHSSDQHPWFVESASGPRSPKRDWYVWRVADPGWTQPWGGTNRTWHRKGVAYYYGVFWSGMPDLNFAHPPVREEMKRLAKLWLDRGVDGFRLDATRHLFADGPGERQNDRPETHAFLGELAAYVREVKPDAVLVGENWTDTPTIAAYFGRPGAVELPMNFNFPLAEAIVGAVRAGDPAPVAAVLDEMARLYPASALDAPFLTNHDQVRLATALDGDPSRLALAASILLTLPGAPFLYYGEEVGLANGDAAGDPAKRTPMPWDAAGTGFSTGEPWAAFAPGRERANVEGHERDSGSLLHHYRRWIRRRLDSPALARGALARLPVASPLLGWTTELEGRRLLVVHNLGDSEARARLLDDAPGPRRVDRLEGEGRALAGERGLEVTLPPRSSAVFARD